MLPSGGHPGIISGSIFQAFSRSIYSIRHLGRQLMVLLPVAWLLSRTGNVTMVLWAFPIAEGFSMVLSFIFFKKISGEIVAPMAEKKSRTVSYGVINFCPRPK